MTEKDKVLDRLREVEKVIRRGKPDRGERLSSRRPEEVTRSGSRDRMRSEDSDCG